MADEKMPWEKNGEEFDAERAKAYIVGLNRDVENLKARNKDLLSKSKDAGKGSKELREENLKLQVQIQTGLNDRQIARLTGDTLDEMLEDAEAYAEETGIELRSLLEPDEDSTGTPGNDQGDPDDGENEEQKQVARNFRPPAQKPGTPSSENVDYDKIAQGLDLGF